MRYGESLWTISKKYNISIHDLAGVNKIRNKNRVKVGQKLNVPLKGGQIWGNNDNGGNILNFSLSNPCLRKYSGVLKLPDNPVFFLNISNIQV